MRSVYKIVRTEEEVDLLIKYIRKTRYCSHDWETTDLKYYSEVEFPICIGISFQPGSAWVVPLYHPESPFLDNWEYIINKLGREIFEDPTITFISQNTKFEYKWFLRLGITLSGRIFDNMLAKHLLNEEKPHGLKDLVAKYLPEFAGYENEVDNTKLFHTPLEKVAKYNALDADLTFRLFLFFEDRLIKLGFYPLFRNLFTPLTSVLGKCEYYGIKVDREYLTNLVEKYTNLIKLEEQKLRSNKVLRRYERNSLDDKKQCLIDKLQAEIDDLQSAASIANRQKKIDIHC